MAAADPDLDALCRLARLDPDAATRARLAERLHRVLAAFAALPVVDAAEEAGAAAMRLRPDEPAPSLPLERVLGNSARTAADCFVVPRVVEG